MEKLKQIETRYEELTAQLALPEVLSDRSRYQKIARTHRGLQEVVEKYRELKGVEKSINDTESLLREEQSDPVLRTLAHEELKDLEQQQAKLKKEVRILLLPKNPNDEKNVILEIRAGTGGDEATLFAQEIFRMYTRYGEGQGWHVDVLSSSTSSVGGLKEIIALIEGEYVYSQLKFESGVHRVQRVPKTEQQGRVHTSAITVAVLPEVDEVEIEIDAKEIRIDTFCSSGPGGQSVNTTYSAVRITHLATGIVVSCQDEKSQIKNRSKAMRVLRSRLYEKKLEEQQSQITEERRSQIGSGDRSEKIRTYNFSQNRVTDHRIGLNLHELVRVLDGNLNPIIKALIAHHQTESLKQTTKVK